MHKQLNFYGLGTCDYVSGELMISLLVPQVRSALGS